MTLHARPDDADSRLQRLGEAMDVFLAFQRSGEDAEAFLSRHEHLRDLLAPMLQETAAGRGEGPAEPGEDPLPADGRLAPEQRLGDYRIVREVGRGGMGTVYEAEQISLRRHVALKLLHAHLTWSPSGIARFRREAAAAARLTHPGIVPIHEVGEWRGRHYFTMEFVRGRPLHELMDQPRLGVRGDCSRPAEVAELTARVADALQHAHDHGLVHRDVKPHNILVGDDGSVRLLDFGLARQVDGVTDSVTGEFVGTPHYCSPEHAAGTQVGPPSDVFSLGIVLYELLAGRRPFVGASARQVLRCIEAGDCEPLGRVARGTPRDLQVICAKAMERLPADRYPSAGELAADLRRFLRIEPIRARSPHWWARAGKWLRRHRLRVALWGMFLLLLGGAPTVYALHAANTRDVVESERQSLHEAEKIAFEGIERTIRMVGEQLDREPGPGSRQLPHIAEVVRSCEAFVANRAGDASRQIRVARACYDLADVHRKLGAYAAAMAACERAAELLAAAAASGAPPDSLDEPRGRVLRRQLHLRQHMDPGGGSEEFARAIALWQELAERPGAPDETVVEFAETLLVRARVLVMHTRDRLEAERLLLQARAVLAARRPAAPHAELVALRVGNALGYAQLWSGRTEEALLTFTEVRDLAAAGIGDPARAVEHGIALGGLGEARQKVGKAGDAERDLRAAIDTLAGPAAEFPGARHLARNLLTARVRLGSLLLSQRKVADAEAVLRGAAAVPGAAAPSAESWMDRSLRADLDVQLANCILMRCEAGGDCDEAAQLLHGACALLEELVREQPDQTDQQVDLGGAWNNLAALANQRGDATAARQFAAKAIACQQAVLALAPETRRARLFLGMHHGQMALALAALDQPAEAVAAAKAAMQWAGRHAPTLRLAAEASTRAASGVDALSAMPAEERTRAVDASARVAVAALEQLARLDREQARRLLADPRFAFLRDRADFAALQIEVTR